MSNTNYQSSLDIVKEVVGANRRKQMSSDGRTIVYEVDGQRKSISIETYENHVRNLQNHVGTEKAIIRAEDRGMIKRI